MITKNVNFAIAKVSLGLRYAILFGFAIILSNLLWWLVSPLVSEVYVVSSPLSKFENSAKSVTNQTPFGVVVIPKIQVATEPPIVEKIDLVGVYATNNPSDTVAFFEVDKKPSIFKIGDTVAEGAVLKAVYADHAVVAVGDQLYNLKVVGGTTKANDFFPRGVDSYPTRYPSNYSGYGENEYNRNNGGGYSNNQNNNQRNGYNNQSSYNNASNENYPTDDASANYQAMLANRKRLVEQTLQRQNSQINNN